MPALNQIRATHAMSPRGVFIYHAAGLGGFGGSSYIDSVILRDRDANTDWDAASDGVLEERIYYGQNWRHDVVALITDAGAQVQQVRYSAYGIPFGLPAGDVNSDGSVTSADDTIITGWIGNSTYDVRGDLNLDGVVDNSDRSVLRDNIGNALGWNALSLDVDAAGGGGGNRKGYAGYEGDFSRDGFWHVRHRVLNSELGRWTRSSCDKPGGTATPICGLFDFLSCRISIMICKNIPDGNSSKPEGFCGILLHELVHAKQICELGLCKLPCREFLELYNDPVGCMLREVEAHEIQGVCEGYWCCEDACNSCTEFYRKKGLTHWDCIKDCEKHFPPPFDFDFPDFRPTTDLVPKCTPFGVN